MSFGKLKRALQSLINRKDLTDDLAGDFINRAVDEIERQLRIGPMEALLEASSWDGTANSITIPSNYLQLIDIFTDGGTLRLVDKDAFFCSSTTGRPLVFMKTGASWLVKPTPAAGTTVFVQYYAESPPLQVDTDENVWTKACFNAVLYTAASLAADHFQMEDQYVQRFDGKAQALVTAIDGQNWDEKWNAPLAIGAPKDIGEY
jgi:hypothetical protein